MRSQKPKLLRKLSFSLVVALLSSCAVNIPNVRTVSAVPPEMGVAALYQDTLSDDNGEFDMDQWVNFLYAQVDDKSTPKNEEKGPAVCMSSVDFARIKTAMEQLCIKIRCTYEQKKIISDMTYRVESLQANVEMRTFTPTKPKRKIR